MAKFEPKYEITNSIANNLIQIERVKEGIKNLPINPKLLTSLRETAKNDNYSLFYSNRGKQTFSRRSL